jgi:3-phenylpropionate/cinnamic acid dioxygenase small subunit
VEFLARVPAIHERKALVTDTATPDTATPDTTTPKTTTPDPALVERTRRLPATDPVRAEIIEFLEDEAALLDEGDLLGWMGVLTEDIVYRAPVRVTREVGDRSPFEQEMRHYDETATTLMLKIMRITQTKSAWAETPPSRTRRFVTNVRVYETSRAEEHVAESNVLLLRSRYDEAAYDLLSGRRHDVIRRVDEAWKLASRTVYLDQTTLGFQNLAVYL